MGVSLAELEVLISLQTIGQGQLNSLKGSLLGMATGAGAAAIGIGALYEVGKSALDNYEAQQTASKDLAQAFATQGQKVPTKEIQAFLDKNKDLIDNQYDAEKAIATAERAGISWKDTQNLMNDALGLSIDRGISMSEAMDTLTKAAAGGRVQLAYLGITSSQLTATTNDVADAQKAATAADEKKAAADRALQEGIDKINTAHSVTLPMLDHLQDLKAKDLAATQVATDAHNKLADAQNSVNSAGDRAATLHDLLALKLKNEGDKYTDLQKHQHDLNTDWQDFTAKIGPDVTTIIDGIVQAMDNGVGIAGVWMDLMHKTGAIGSDIGNVVSDLAGNRLHPATTPAPAPAPTNSTQTVNLKVSAAPGLIVTSRGASATSRQ